MRLEKWPTINRSLQLDKTNPGGGAGGPGGRGSGQIVRKVRSFWSNGFSASIILPERTLRPGRKLHGKVIIHSKALVTFTGLRVQLDAQCTLFLEKNGELVTKRFGVLQQQGLQQQNDNGHPSGSGAQQGQQQQGNNNVNNVPNNRKGSIGPGGVLGGGIFCEAVEWLGNTKEVYALIPDINSVVDALTFPFCLEVPGDRAFPCPFNNSVGTLVYKLSAHLCAQDMRYAQIAEETIDFKGYANLSTNLSETSKCVAIERPIPGHPPLISASSITSTSSTSLASSASAAAASEVFASFKVEASGFLAEEAVHFTLHVKNPKKLPMHMKVFIAQKITYGITENCWKKVTSSVVRCERVEVNLGGTSSSGGDLGEILWRGALIIPKGQIPSFSTVTFGYPCYGVVYTIQFKVEGLDHDWSLKGTAPMFIGTCRSNVHQGRLITG